MTNQKDHNFVPVNYDELCTHYVIGSTSLVNSIVRSMLPYASSEEREDVVQQTVVRALHYDIIKRFDPTKGNFGGIIFTTTRSAVTKHLAQKERQPVEGRKASSLRESTDEFEPGVYSLEKIFAVDSNEDAKLDARAQVKKMFEIARTALERNGHKRDRSLLSLLKLLWEGYNPQECAKALNVTVTTVSNWVSYLKMEVAQ